MCIFPTFFDGRPCRFWGSLDILVSHGGHPGRSWGHMECLLDVSGGSWGKRARDWSVKGVLEIEFGECVRAKTI